MKQKAMQLQRMRDAVIESPRLETEGRTLEYGTRGQLEPSFEHSFTHVRVFDDATSGDRPHRLG